MAQGADSTVHDVVVIGSGAGGGTVTKVLTDMGIRVLLLEAGPMIQMSDFKTMMGPSDFWHRGAGEAAELYTTGQTAALNYSASFAANTVDEPYTVAPGSSFRLFRSRVIGGRTNHYARVQLRYSDYDFKPKSMNDAGFDWPIGYDDIAPYYDKVERFIGVTGRPEGLRSAPDGIFQRPAPFKVHEELVYRACARLGIKATSSRHAVITSPLNGRPACIYCGQCGRGCRFGSNYASSYVQIFPAMRSGRLTVVTDAMARELVTDASGKVSEVLYIDKTTGAERRVRCRTVVLAASACESARLLLNSKSSRHPDGLANSSGMVGKYLTDTVGFGMSATVPYLRGTPIHNTDGYGAHLYIPWWMADQHNRLDFPLGYHVEVGGGGFGMPTLGFGAAAYNRVEGYGLPMKQAIRESYGGITISLSGRGSMVPNEDCYCEIDPDVKDKWGIPVLRFHWKWGDSELNMARHMRESFRAILETLGGTINQPGGRGGGAGRAGGAGAEPDDDRPQLGPGGGIIHEIGCVRMGDDPRTSVVNRFCQAHDVPNLFSADGGPFVSHADKNPTHTIMALAWRTAEYLAEEMRKGNV
ncbi:MAG: GMC family oxidoreductase [Acidobacteriota bacterium]|jgi:choline dehydrogenase-like flavoprotein|nr:MAG: GMC family oxidoreductase [Acidobacteriota bacterium]